MKYAMLFALAIVSACSTMDSELAAHLEAERDFARHQYHTQQAHEKQYDPEYVDDCYYHEDLVCEFE
jgi:hypothetical protein